MLTMSETIRHKKIVFPERRAADVTLVLVSIVLTFAMTGTLYSASSSMLIFVISFSIFLVSTSVAISMSLGFASNSFYPFKLLATFVGDHESEIGQSSWETFFKLSFVPICTYSIIILPQFVLGAVVLSYLFFYAATKHRCTRQRCCEGSVNFRRLSYSMFGVYLNTLERNFSLLCVAGMAVLWYSSGHGFVIVFGLLALSLVRTASIVGRYGVKPLLELSPYRIRLSVYGPILALVGWLAHTLGGRLYG